MTDEDAVAGLPPCPSRASRTPTSSSAAPSVESAPANRLFVKRFVTSAARATARGAIRDTARTKPAIFFCIENSPFSKNSKPAYPISSAERPGQSFPCRTNRAHRIIGVGVSAASSGPGEASALARAGPDRRRVVVSGTARPRRRAAPPARAPQVAGQAAQRLDHADGRGEDGQHGPDARGLTSAPTSSAISTHRLAAHEKSVTRRLAA